MKKNRKLYLSLTGMTIIIISFLVIHFKQYNKTSLLSNSIILKQYEAKGKYYYNETESPLKKAFEYSWKKSLSSLKSITGQILMIGERTYLADYRILIQQVVFYKEGNKVFAKYLRTTDSVVTSKVLEIPIVLPQLPRQCDSHYFYLPNASNVDTLYNGYSLLQINGEDMSDIKIFFSEKFDSFINVSTPCSYADIKEILVYLNKQFDDQK